jgi:hypothetical protein
MSRVLSTVLLFFALVACAPAPTAYRDPGVSVSAGVLVVREPSGRVLVNAALGVPAFPGSRIIAQRYTNRASSTEFEAQGELQAVYGFFHNALLDKRWTRASYTLRGETRIEARYVGPGEDLSLTLERITKTRFRLSLE